MLKFCLIKGIFWLPLFFIEYNIGYIGGPIYVILTSVFKKSYNIGIKISRSFAKKTERDIVSPVFYFVQKIKNGISGTEK